MRDDSNDDPRDLASGEENASDEEVTQGRDVHDLSRESETRGRDVLTDAEGSEGIESHGRTVVDRTHISEARGVDVIDLGPATPDDEPHQP